MHHALAFQANERFEVVGVCTSTRSVGRAAARFGAAQGTDARQLCAPSSPISSASAPFLTCASEMVRAGIDGGAASDRRLKSRLALNTSKVSR